MTTREMQIEFERLIQAIYPDFATITREQLNSDTIMYFLNLAQDRYIKENYLSKEQIKQSIEYINKRSDVLKNLIARAKEQTSDSSYGSPLNDGGYKLDLPTDYMFYLDSSAKVKRTDGYLETNYDYVPTRLILHDERESVLTTPFNKPILRKPAILLEGTGDAILYIDQYTDCNNVEFIYLKQPSTMVLGSAGAGEVTESELAEHTHKEIVEKAASMFIEEYKFKLSTKQ